MTLARIEAALPSPFEFDPRRTAVLMMDLQRDFIKPGGFGAALGNGVSLRSLAIVAKIGAALPEDVKSG